MKLKSLQVRGYKNIRACAIDFTSPAGLHAVIGGNGSGKSNLIEAVLQILIGCYFRKPPHFEFRFEFEAQHRKVVLEREGGRASVLVDDQRLSLNHFALRLRDGPAQVFYPELTLVYYSGQCQRTQTLVDGYRRHFQRLVREPNTDRFRPLFVQASNEQSQVILLALFAHKRKKLLERLRLQAIEDVAITLRSPLGFDPNLHEPKLWNSTGAIGRIVAAIDEAASDQTTRRIETVALEGNEESLQTEGPSIQREERTYLFGGDSENRLEKLARRLELANENLYLALEGLRNRGMLRNVHFRLRGRDANEAFEFSQLSEGEKQLLAVIGALTLTKQGSNLALLDEPDTHLNPQWSWDYPSMLAEAIPSDATSSLLIATHDPVTISGMTRDQVLLAQPDGTGFTRPRRNPRGQGVANLLCSSEFFGLPSSLDKATQELLDERLAISAKLKLTSRDKARLRVLNEQIEILPGVSERDPNYVAFLREQDRSRPL